MHRFAVPLAIGALWLGGCNGEPPDNPPQPPPVTTTVPAPEPPPEPTERQPEEYITKERAGNCVADPQSRDNTGLCRELFVEIQENASRGWRDYLVLLDRCPWSMPPDERAVFTWSIEQALVFAEHGQSLDAEGWGFIRRLGETNRRCDEKPEFCGRTNVQKDRFMTYRSALLLHLARANRDQEQLRNQPGHGVLFDSLAGWCQAQEL